MQPDSVLTIGVGLGGTKMLTALVGPDGEVYLLVGLNGAGKTTTFRTLMGLLRPDAGAAWVEGHEPGPDPVSSWRRHRSPKRATRRWKLPGPRAWDPSRAAVRPRGGGAYRR